MRFRSADRAEFAPVSSFEDGIPGVKAARAAGMEGEQMHPEGIAYLAESFAMRSGLGARRGLASRIGGRAGRRLAAALLARAIQARRMGTAAVR